MNLYERITAYQQQPAHLLQDPDARYFWATFPNQPELTNQEADVLNAAMAQHNPMQLFTFVGYYRHAQATGQKLYGGWDTQTVEQLGALLDRLNGRNWR